MGCRSRLSSGRRRSVPLPSSPSALYPQQSTPPVSEHGAVAEPSPELSLATETALVMPGDHLRGVVALTLSCGPARRPVAERSVDVVPPTVHPAGQRAPRSSRRNRRHSVALVTEIASVIPVTAWGVS